MRLVAIQEYKFGGQRDKVSGTKKEYEQEKEGWQKYCIKMLWILKRFRLVATQEYHVEGKWEIVSGSIVKVLHKKWCGF